MTDEKPPDEKPPDEQPPPDDGGDDAGDVEALRREAAKFRRELRAAQTANDELRRANEQLRVEHESDAEKREREIRADERAKVTAEFAGERLNSRLLVRATGKLRDPELASTLLADRLAPDADDATLDEAIDELIKQRDYLAAPPANGERAGLVTQGARSSAPGSSREQTPDDWIRARARGH